MLEHHDKAGEALAKAQDMREDGGAHAVGQIRYHHQWVRQQSVIVLPCISMDDVDVRGSGKALLQPVDILRIKLDGIEF
jgi:hypothetical protein